MSPRMTSGSFWKEREAEWAETRKLRERIAELEAEVERLSRRDSAATAMLAILATREQWAEFQRVARGVNPSGDTLGRGGRESGDQGPGSVPGRPGRPAAANPAAPSLSARKVTPKTDDAPTAPCPNCGAELTWFKHAWARKERASSD